MGGFTRTGWCLRGNPLRPIAQSGLPDSQVLSNLAAPVSQQLTRRRAGRFAVIERELAIHDDRPIATGALHSTPFPARQIVYDLTREFALDSKSVQVINHDVRPPPFAQGSAIAETRCVRGQCREAI